jgi:large subunit ribosomal protein L1
MGKIGKIAKVLGPRGLLPNKKLGTVVFDVAPVISELKKGLSFFKNDKYGLVHFYVGKCSFEDGALAQNIHAFMKTLVSARPATTKGRYVEKITLTSTMGPGVQVDVGEFVA